jgi:hypothetical protein
LQRQLLVSLQQRIMQMLKEALAASRSLTRDEAEQLAWQQIEEELIHLFT